MKKILSLFGLLCLVVNGFAQTQTENYVFSTTCLTADCVKKMEVIQYSDGLGRPKQIVNVAASPSGKDVVTHIEYDGLGRQIKDYLPTPQSGTSTRNIRTQSEATSSAAYGVEKIYGEKVLESSPLGRMLEQTQPGSAWENTPITFDYKANSTSEVLRFRTVTGSQNGANYVQNLIIDGHYPQYTLYKNKVTDEDGNTTTEFKNAQGQTLLVRKTVENEPQASLAGAPAGPGLSSENVDTYYVYNEFNQLALVITPMASREFKSNPNQTIASPAGNSIIKELCYQYRYDSRERLVEKKLPGKGWEYFVYDRQDRLIMTQDANLGASGQWTFNKFDQYGRPAYAGLCNPGGGNRISPNMLPDVYRQTQQTAADAAGSNNVFRTDSFVVDYSGIKILYTVGDSYPVYNTVTQLLSLNYYDKYPTLDDNYASGGTALPARTDYVLGQKTLSDNDSAQKISTKGLPVASYINIIGGSQWTKTFLWYDELGRGIGSHTINHLGGSTVAYSVLDFAGAPVKTETWHKRLDSETPIHIVENFEYDDQKRLLKHYHEVEGKTPKELLADNHYNEKGELDKKKVGAGSDENFTAVSPPLQEISYDYNIRSWMTGINLKQDDPARPLDPARLFSYKIKYNDPASASPRYNGNIAEIDWVYEGNDVSRYAYHYDALNRLLLADYKTIKTTGTADNQYYNEQLSYDLNGNILSLKRNARPQNTTQAAVQVDKLKYYYENGNLSNKVWKITDNEGNTANPSGYPGGGATMTYDANGNMLTMPDKGITQPISYNYQNLPQTVVQNGQPVNYTYRADGVKVHKQFVVNGQSIETDYLDGFVYTTPYTETLEMALTENPEMASARQPEAFELAAREVVAYPGTPMLNLQSSPNFFPTAEGFYDYENSKYIYQYKDHLGNVRLSFAKNLDDGSVQGLSSNDYYPFGLNFINIRSKVTHPPVYNPSVSFENYKYNGKELEETGMYDYGARFYMPDIGRFGMYDPLAEKTFEPYAYVYNNPIGFYDPTGMEGEESASSDSGGGGETGAGGGENEGKGFNSDTAGRCPPDCPEFNNGGRATSIEQVNLTKVTPIKSSSSPTVSLGSTIAMFTLVLNDGIRGMVMPNVSRTATIAFASRSVWALPLILNGDAAKTDDEDKIPNITLYRGVHAKHPDLANAYLGNAFPWGGSFSAKDHNRGHNNSMFTSWSTSIDVANYSASRRGSGGVILKQSFPLYRLSFFDRHGEGEVQVFGPVTGAQVIKPWDGGTWTPYIK